MQVQDAPQRNTTGLSSSPRPFYPQPQAAGRSLPIHTALSRVGPSPPSHWVGCAPFFSTIACGTLPAPQHSILFLSLLLEFHACPQGHNAVLLCWVQKPGMPRFAQSTTYTLGYRADSFGQTLLQVLNCKKSS